MKRRLSWDWPKASDQGAQLVRCSNGMHFLLERGKTLEDMRRKWPADRFEIVPWPGGPKQLEWSWS